MVHFRAHFLMIRWQTPQIPCTRLPMPCTRKRSSVCRCYLLAAIKKSLNKYISPSVLIKKFMHTIRVHTFHCIMNGNRRATYKNQTNKRRVTTRRQAANSHSELPAVNACIASTHMPPFPMNNINLLLFNTLSCFSACFSPSPASDCTNITIHGVAH